jgi:hypothetical protein
MRRSLMALVLILASLSVAAADLPARTSAAGGVTLKATPRSLAASAWEFALAFDTHTQDLSDDVAKTARLIADGGTAYAPLEWQGDPPGGHHRSGVLRFRPVTPVPQAIELRVQRAGESAPRSFRWELR